MTPSDRPQRGTAKRRVTGGERSPRVRGRKQTGVRAPWPGAARCSRVGCSPRDREVQRQLSRLLAEFPECRDKLRQMLDLCDPRVAHTAAETARARELAEMLTSVLQFLSMAYRDAVPALTITCGAAARNK